MRRHQLHITVIAASMLTGLTGCADVAPNYDTAAAHRYDAPYCDGLVRFYWAYKIDSTRFSDGSPQLLSAFLGYNILHASAGQIGQVKRQLDNCEIYYAGLERPGGPDPLASLYTRYRAGRAHAVIARLLAVVPYRPPEPILRQAAARPAPPTIKRPPPAPIIKPKPIHQAAPSVATIEPTALPPPTTPQPAAPKKAPAPGCSSPKTVSSLLASYRTYYGQNIAELQHYKTITRKSGTKFTYCSAYAIIPNDSHTIDYKFTTTPHGTVNVSPVGSANP